MFVEALECIWMTHHISVAYNCLIIKYGIAFMELLEKSGANATSSGNKNSLGSLIIDGKIFSRAIGDD